MKPNTIVFAMILTAAMTATIPIERAYAVDVSVQNQLRDAELEGRIYASYALNRHLNPFEFKVDVSGDSAAINGTVTEAVDKDLAEQIALSIPGIKRVENQIIVDENFKPNPRASSDRSFSEIVSDATITASVKSKLLWNNNTRNMNPHVATRSGVVVLTGTAGSGADRDLAGYLAQNTDGVRAVENRLRALAPNDSAATAQATAGKPSESASEKIADSWISTKVKSSFLYSKYVSASDIKVDTVNGVVMLSGQVASDNEKEMAISIAKNIRGVRKIDADDLVVNHQIRQTADNAPKR